MEIKPREVDTSTAKNRQKVADLLEEYSTKCSDRLSELQASRIGKNNQFLTLMVAMIALMVVIPMVGGLDVVGDAGLSVRLYFLAVSGLIPLVMGSILFLRWRKLNSTVESQKFQAKTVLVKLEKVMRFADETLEHTELDPVERLELSLRVAEASAIIRRGRDILGDEYEDVREYEFEKV